ncbi:hypothetical protein [Mycobacterium sp. NPDC050441]|uniref:hypothetical protein n=1 Tax=Mycobacterium sp. NPDC050441 TaxID=3155403 RepID=UPI0033FCE7A8
MTRFCDGYVLLAGMRDASTASVSYAGTVGAEGIARQSVERHALWHPRCFRSTRLENFTRSVGVRPGRKHGPEEQSQKSLNFTVVAGSDVA